MSIYAQQKMLPIVAFVLVAFVKYATIGTL